MNNTVLLYNLLHLEKIKTERFVLHIPETWSMQLFFLSVSVKDAFCMVTALSNAVT